MEFCIDGEVLLRVSIFSRVSSIFRSSRLFNKFSSSSFTARFSFLSREKGQDNIAKLDIPFGRIFLKRNTQYF